MEQKEMQEKTMTQKQKEKKEWKQHKKDWKRKHPFRRILKITSISVLTLGVVTVA